mgnify:CR=1 FL=1
MLKHELMDNEKPKVVALFPELDEDLQRHIKENAARSEQANHPTNRLKHILGVIRSLEGPVSQQLNQRIDEMLSEAPYDIGTDEQTDAYVLERLDKVIQVHPALQLALHLRGTHSKPETHDPFPEL